MAIVVIITTTTNETLIQQVVLLPSNKDNNDQIHTKWMNSTEGEEVMEDYLTKDNGVVDWDSQPI